MALSRNWNEVTEVDTQVAGEKSSQAVGHKPKGTQAGIHLECKRSKGGGWNRGMGRGRERKGDEVREARVVDKSDHIDDYGSQPWLHLDSPEQIFKLLSPRLYPRPIKLEPLGLRPVYQYFFVFKLPG
jgi:hypothetical protein